MPRIRTLGPGGGLARDVGAMFDRFQPQRGNIPNMFRTMALSPRDLRSPPTRTWTPSSTLARSIRG